MALRDRCEALRVGRWARRTRRQDARGRRATNFPQESLELYRREAHEHARRIGTSTDERMRDARRAESAPPGARSTRVSPT